MPVWAVDLQVMGGPAALRLSAAASVDLPAAAQAAERELRRLEARYSRFRPDAWLAQVNAHSGSNRRWRVDEESAALLDLGATLHRLSNGAFDLTAGALQRVWDFGAGRPPPADALRAALRCVGWSRVHWDGRELALPEPCLSLDFGGLVKEYAADRAAQLLRSLGVAGGYVNLAGDLALIGPQADGSAWPLAIQHPREPAAVLATLGMAQGALATSGDYERGFVFEGRRYHHLLDARSGWPVQHWASVSVAAPSCASAGALATLAMLQQQAGLALLQDSGCAFLAMESSGNVHNGLMPIEDSPDTPHR